MATAAKSLTGYQTSVRSYERSPHARSRAATAAHRHEAEELRDLCGWLAEEREITASPAQPVRPPHVPKAPDANRSADDDAHVARPASDGHQLRELRLAAVRPDHRQRHPLWLQEISSHAVDIVHADVLDDVQRLVNGQDRIPQQLLRAKP